APDDTSVAETPISEAPSPSSVSSVPNSFLATSSKLVPEAKSSNASDCHSGTPRAFSESSSPSTVLQDRALVTTLCHMPSSETSLASGTAPSVSDSGLSPKTGSATGGAAAGGAATAGSSSSSGSAGASG